MLIDEAGVYFGNLTPEGQEEISRLYEIEAKICTTHALVSIEPSVEDIETMVKIWTDAEDTELQGQIMYKIYKAIGQQSEGKTMTKSYVLNKCRELRGDTRPCSVNAADNGAENAELVEENYRLKQTVALLEELIAIKDGNAKAISALTNP